MHDEVTTYPLIAIHDSCTVLEGARLMADCSAGALGVLDDDRRFEGIFTERDLTQFVSQGRDPAETRMREVVNDFPVVVEGPITRQQASEKMRKARIRHLIVRRSEDEYRIVSMRDLYLTPPETTPSEIKLTEGEDASRALRASDVMSSPPVACRSDTLIEEIAEILADRDISGMPVVDEDETVVGVVSERDVAHALGSPLVRLALRRHPHHELFLRRPAAVDFAARRAKNIMTAPAFVARVDQTLEELAEEMLDHGVNRLPVVDDGCLVGVVSRGDLLKGLTHSVPRHSTAVGGAKVIGSLATMAARPSASL